MSGRGKVPESGGPEREVASLRITVYLSSEGTFAVEVPDFEGGEFATTYAGTAAEALQQAGQYVESILFDAPLSPGWPPENPFGDFADFGGPTVGYCSKCGETRDSFYTRDGGETTPKEKPVSTLLHAQAYGLAHQYPGACPHCSGPFSATFHTGPCPRVKAIEYHPDGSVKRIELHPVEPPE